MIESLTGLFRKNMCAGEVDYAKVKKSNLILKLTVKTLDPLVNSCVSGIEKCMLCMNQKTLFLFLEPLSINFHFTLGSEYRLEKALFTF